MIAALSSANLMPPSTLLFFFKKIHSHRPVLFSLNLIRGVLARPALHLPRWHFPTWLETERYVRTTRMVIFCASFWKNTLNIIINCHKSNRHWWLKKWINIKKRRDFIQCAFVYFRVRCSFEVFEPSNVLMGEEQRQLWPTGECYTGNWRGNKTILI